MNNIFLACLILLLSGCAPLLELYQVSSAENYLKDNLLYFLHKDIDTLFDAMGYPSNKQEYGNTTVYSWINNASGVVSMPQTTFHQGVAGASFYRDPAPQISYQGTSTSYSYKNVNYSCEIKIAVSSSNIIKRIDYSVQAGSCNVFIDRLKKHFDG